MKKVLIGFIVLAALAVVGMYAMAWMGTKANDDALTQISSSKDAIVLEVKGMT